jgi:CBS domain-containing membrane protein
VQDVKVSDLMTRKVVTLHRAQSLTLADQLMRLDRVRHLPVVDESGKLVGLVTHRDLLAAHLGSFARLQPGAAHAAHATIELAIPVERIMTTDVWSVREETPAVDTAQLLYDNRFGCAPVVDDQRHIIGIVTEADFLRLVLDMLAQDDELRVRDLMTTDLVTLRADQSLSAAEEMMTLRQIRHLPVVDDDGALLGLITHRDLLAAQYSALTHASDFPVEAPARDVMRDDVWTVSPDTPAIEAAFNLRDHVFGCLPVVEHGKLAGIITEADFLALLVARYGPGRRAAPRYHAPVHYYMSSPVRVVSPEDDLERVHALLSAHGISSLAVVDGTELVGVISQSDLLRVSLPRLAARRRVGARWLPRRTVAEVMTAEVLTVRPHDTVSAAAQRMVTHDIHRLFVVEGKVLVGVLSTMDVTAAVRDIRIDQPVSMHMTAIVFSIDHAEPVSAGVVLLDRAHVSGVVVLDQGWPVGIFSQREALASRHMPRDTPVEHAMSQAFLTVPGSVPLHRVAGQAAALGVRRVIVIEAGQVAGILTGMDFARACTGEALPT